jgi:hypothetical protein
LSRAEASARVKASLASTPVKDVKVITADTVGLPGEEPWVDVTIAGSTGNSPENRWLASLAQGAVADLMRESQLTTQDVVSGSRFTTNDADGKSISIPLGIGSVAGGQDFGSQSDTQLTDHIRRVAAQFNLGVKDLQILHPLSTAYSAVFVVDDNSGTPTWTVDDLRNALDGTPRNVEGSFLTLVSESGSTLLESGAAYRTGRGLLSFASGQDERFGALHGGEALGR